MPDVVRRLGDRGARVDTIYPEEMLTDLGSLEISHDLYVLKSKTVTTLSIAGALHAAGAAILNPYPVSSACRDEIVLSRVLRRERREAPAGESRAMSATRRRETPTAAICRRPRAA